MSAGLVLGLAAWRVLFFPEIQAAVGVWRASDTYGHCFLILPMALYLAWDRRDALAGLAARPAPALAVLAVPVAVVWFLAERLGIMEGRQLAAIAALEVLFLAVLGWRLFRALLAPLLFLVFLVPFGAFATPVLQQVTAWFIVTGLNALGIANYSTDLTMETSAGVFYVAEACAELRFLIAAVAFGVFYALLNYRSPGRRALFIAASILVPILANGVRTLGIVVLGSVLSSAQAAAADHIIYGWVFFSFVMLLLVVCGMPFREPPAGRSTDSVRSGIRAAQAATAPVWAAAAVMVLLGCGPAAAMALAAQAAPVQMTELLPMTSPGGCTPSSGPALVLPAQRVSVVYVCDGRMLTVTIQAFPPRSTADSLNRERRRITGELTAEETAIDALPTAEANGAWSMVRTTGPSRTTAVASWTDGVAALAGISGRILQARNSLLGSPYSPVLVTAAIDPPSRLTAADQRRGEAMLGAFVNVQADLTAKVAAVARSARP